MSCHRRDKGDMAMQSANSMSGFILAAKHCRHPVDCEVSQYRYSISISHGCLICKHPLTLILMREALLAEIIARYFVSAPPASNARRR